MDHEGYWDQAFRAGRIIFVPVGSMIHRALHGNHDPAIDTPHCDCIELHLSQSLTFFLNYNIRLGMTWSHQPIPGWVIYHLPVYNKRCEINQQRLYVDVQIRIYILQSQSMPPV